MLTLGFIGSFIGMEVPCFIHLVKGWVHGTGTHCWDCTLVVSSLVFGIFVERVRMRSTKYAVGHKLSYYYRATGTTF